MAHVPVGSYPFERWALEIQDGLLAAGFDAAVDARGPRAFQVVVPELQSDAAGAALSEIGYLSCPAPALAMGSVKDWRPGLGPARIQQAVMNAAEEYVAREANRQAAAEWSRPEEDLEKRLIWKGYSRPWVTASFGDQVAVNGKPVRLPVHPEGHEHVEEGGRLVVHERVDVAGGMEEIRRKSSDLVGLEIPEEAVRGILAEYFPGGTWTASIEGDVNVYARPTREGPESED